MNAAILISRLLLAVIFFYAGIVKAGASEGFAVTVAHFTILPASAIRTFALVLPWVEILCGLLLVIPYTGRFGAILAAALLLVFISAIGWALSQGLIVDCGCFGEDVPPSIQRMLATLGRDIGLLAITAGLALRRTR